MGKTAKAAGEGVGLGASCLAIGLSLLGACGGPPAERIDIRLVADPNITNEGELSARLETIVVLLDADEGLYPPTPWEEGLLRIEDIDQDGHGELIATNAIADRTTFPTIRIERGGLAADVLLNIRVDGKQAGGETIATGSLRAARIDLGPIDVPFNETLAFQPPRVTSVVPESGAVVAADLLSSAVVVLSKQMNPDRLRSGAYTVMPVGASSPLVPERIDVQFLGPDLETPTIARYVFSSLLAPGRYQITVSPEATDASGRPLDQSPVEPGDQPFRSQFEVVAGDEAALRAPAQAGSAIEQRKEAVERGIGGFVAAVDECLQRGAGLALEVRGAAAVRGERGE